MMDREKLPGLQVARAVAALSIAYFHSWVALARFPAETAYPLPILTSYGWLAVDLFFAISGFVICLVTTKQTFSVPRFLKNRALRLYPLWLATLTIFALLAVIWRGPTESETVGYFLYSATLLPTKEYPFYNIGWSLQHEMLFYLLAAIVIPLMGLYGLAGLLAVSALAFHTLSLPWYLSSFAMYHSEFLAGVLAFILRHRFARFGAAAPLAIGFIALWVCAAMLGRYYVPIALFFIVIGFSNLATAPRALTALGDASYSIYLIHPIIFLIASALVSKTALPIWAQEPIRLICFAAIIGMSLLSWRYFERPTLAMFKNEKRGIAPLPT